MRFIPKPLCNGHGVDSHVVPPGALIAGMVKLAMMGTAERDGELVADFAAERFRLSEADVVSVGGEGATDKAWLRCDETEMILVAEAARLAEGQGALVDGRPQLGGTDRGPGERINNRVAAVAFGHTQLLVRR